MWKLIVCSVVCLFSVGQKISAQINRLTSPDQHTRLNFQVGDYLNDLLTYRLFYNDRPIVITGKIRLNISDGRLVLKKIEQSKKNGRWQTVYGERKFIPEDYSQVKLSFCQEQNGGLQLTLLLRVYNEGFAYQYT